MLYLPGAIQKIQAFLISCDLFLHFYNPANMLLPCWLIGRLAVDLKFQKQNFGQILLADALQSIVTLSKKAGGYCVIVDAKNERVKPFYEKYGFKPVIDDELRLYLPLSAIPMRDI
ncbi:hypothetical protein AGMMS50255_6650 [Spirochaetia bacterium]|nr:hypothetical protein AGMMS50255_6650 [Spirochaetia bacterium]